MFLIALLIALHAFRYLEVNQIKFETIVRYCRDISYIIDLQIYNKRIKCTRYRIMNNQDSAIASAKSNVSFA